MMKMKIAFVTLSLEGGGAEKILSRLILNLHDELDIVLITFYRKGRYLDELLSVPGLRYYCLNADTGNTLSFASRLRKILKDERPSKVVSFLYYPNIITYLSVLGMDIPVILSERSNHRLYLSGSVKHRIWKFLLGRAFMCLFSYYGFF
jgi:UDP-N-acetylglucosamine:LPS N-acetylglucosamine transferase